jgi:hypothetical protein
LSLSVLTKAMMRYSRNPCASLPTFWSGFTSVFDLGGDSSLDRSFVEKCLERRRNRILDDIERLYEDYAAVAYDFNTAVENLGEEQPD